MAGVWSKVKVLDIAFPSNGTLTPGSGTVYIGGPRLPVELRQIGAAGGLVFYSDAGDTAADYYYVAYFVDSGAFSINIGVKLSSIPGTAGLKNYFFARSTTTDPLLQLRPSGPGIGGTGRVRLSSDDATNSLTVNNNGISAIAGGAGDDVTLTADGEVSLNATGNIEANATGGQIELNAPLVDIGRQTGAHENVKFFTGAPGFSPYLKNVPTGMTATRDVWLSITSLQNINIRNSAGVIVQTINNVNLAFDWRITPDMMIDLRCTLSFPAVPTPGAATNSFSFNLPAALNGMIDIGFQTLQGPTMYGIAAGGGNHGSYNGLITPGSPNVCTMYLQGNPNGNFFFILSGTFTLPKP